MYFPKDISRSSRMLLGAGEDLQHSLLPQSMVFTSGPAVISISVTSITSSSHVLQSGMNFMVRCCLSPLLSGLWLHVEVFEVRDLYFAVRKAGHDLELAPHGLDMGAERADIHVGAVLDL